MLLGIPNKVKLTTNEAWFSQWGALDNDKLRILFVDGSVAGGPNMFDEYACFGRVSELLDEEVFAVERWLFAGTIV